MSNADISVVDVRTYFIVVGNVYTSHTVLYYGDIVYMEGLPYNTPLDKFCLCNSGAAEASAEALQHQQPPIHIFRFYPAGSVELLCIL